MGRYQTSSRFSWKKLAAGYVILDLEKGNYFTLNDTASVIWEAMVAGRPVDDIASGLVESFDVSPDRAREDVAETVALLVKEGVLELA